MKIAERKNIAIEAAIKSGKILLKNFRRPITTKFKGDKSLVTNIDLKVEDAIVKLIKGHFTKDSILSEENRYLRRGAEFRWIIDPLDGTHNYIHGIDAFGTSIALEFEGEVVFGAICMPVPNELYTAGKGEGAYRNGKKISVSKRRLNQTTLIYDSSIRYNKKPMLAALDRLVDKVFNVRMFGSTARHLSDIASGKVEVDVEFNDKVWDFAAGLLLVEEAGGKSTDFQGNKWSTKTKGYIASNGIVHDDILRLIK
ncbi:MAG: inositol monophosphatase [Candidatus Omnitrophota bacterium]|nr:MAG: inositol monophosphatase [Candidatus Omnitrophota bacterium]